MVLGVAAQTTMYTKLLHSRLWWSGLATLLLCAILFMFGQSSTSFRTRALPTPERPDDLPPILPREIAANNTLGFQKILALSTRPSWRTRGLTAAASLTNLKVDIPDHPPLTDELVNAFGTMGDKGDEPALPPAGAARAWLSHLDLLRFVVQSGLETALIFEDDVDWDLEVKDQMRLVSDNVRKYRNTPQSDPHPYGLDWDILWIGHCGDVTWNNTERLEYLDPTVLKQADYVGWSREYNHATWPEGHRLIQNGYNPICTFAYAVTRRGARRILRWAGKGREEAFDVRLAKACPDRALEILVVQPELMHHYQPPDDDGLWSEVKVGNGQGPPSSEADAETSMGHTENILQSARCKALFNSTCRKASS